MYKKELLFVLTKNENDRKIYEPGTKWFRAKKKYS